MTRVIDTPGARITYTRFDPPHLLREYKGKTGYEVGGLALSPMALAALAEGIQTGVDPLVVIGRWDRDDGAFFLDVAAPTGYVASVSAYRYDDDAKRLRLNCPDCGMKDGRHTRGCSA
jgi:hypothetical protein